MLAPDYDGFVKMAEHGNLVPVFMEIHHDLETPVSAFQKLGDGLFSFLLESVEGGEKWGRYTFLGSDPRLVLRGRRDKFEILKGDEIVRKGREQDPLRVLEKVLTDFKPYSLTGLPRFWGGLVGYLGYDAVKSFERIPDSQPRDIDLYDYCFMMTDSLVVFDNLRQKAMVIANAYIDGSTTLEKAYRDACEKIERIVLQLKDDPVKRKPRERHIFSPVQSNLTKGDFSRAVERAKEYIKAGDAIQIVLSQRFSKQIHCDPFEIYRALRSLNPSPYLFFLKMGDVSLLGSSPEVMVRVEERRVELRPLAGTRPRGRTQNEDGDIERELLNDEKERAEHIMLVDLGRNDVGRVAEIGSVEVTELMGVERYSHVMHIVSHIRGRLRRDRTVFDALKAAFPAGTVSGAPKVRAMQIIEELEPVCRGPYGGAVGYIGFAGNLDTCITIRSAVVKDGWAYVQAGAGIVADSDPEKEYVETVNKARAVLRAIEIAEGGLE